jgi:hypothetical protein
MASGGKGQLKDGLKIELTPKGGTLKHRSREAEGVCATGYRAGQVYKEREFGIGPSSDVPYMFGTIQSKVYAVTALYKAHNVKKDDNPGMSQLVKDTLRMVKLILGEGRMKLPDTLSPEVALRIIGALDAENERQVLLAVLLALGMTLGERPSTLFLRDIGEISVSEQGVLIFTPYTKSDFTREGGGGPSAGRKYTILRMRSPRSFFHDDDYYFRPPCREYR